MVYLVWQLRQAKFEVRFTWPNLLYISWRHHEGDYLTRQNPIIKAMMPEQKALPKPIGSQKKKGGMPSAPSANANSVVSFNNEIDIINMPQGAPLPQARRAIDYEPPASFVQNMERPGPGRPDPRKAGGNAGNVLSDLWS